MDYINAAEQLIRSRRSIYPSNYTGEKISNELIWKILDLANQAPNHKKTEPWRFIVYTGQGLEKLSAFESESYRKSVSPDRFSDIKYKKTKGKALKSSHVIAICMHPTPDLLPEWEEIAAVSCAVQNLWLACCAHDLGCYWSTPKYAVGEDAFFELKPGEKCLGLFYIGIPQKELAPKSGRKPIEDKTRWIE
ncbi:MAG: nitroreductase [Bacteroidia bacterium]|nr:nitroreductase [Bacteroidia bacterium]